MLGTALHATESLHADYDRIGGNETADEDLPTQGTHGLEKVSGMENLGIGGFRLGLG